LSFLFLSRKKNNNKITGVNAILKKNEIKKAKKRVKNYKPARMFLASEIIALFF
jgi:hypothetical protein